MHLRLQKEMKDEMAEWIFRLARSPRYIWQNLPMEDRRLAHLGIVLLSFATMVGFSEGRKLVSSVEGAESMREAPTCPTDTSALLDLRISLSLRDDEWPTDSDPCSSWRGILCEDGHVVEIMISGLGQTSLMSSSQMHFSSSIHALQQLPFLRILNASGYNLLGSFPVGLVGFGSLEVMDLVSTSLSGSIPSSIGQLCKLKILRLGNNSLTGVIPPTMGNLTSLTSLDLSCNNLSGRIPATFGNLAELKVLNLSLNRLDGDLPLQLGQLSGLQRLLIGSNDLSGSIPSLLGGLNFLTHIDLSFNSFSGSIPADLGRLLHLTDLNLEDNEIEGTIPPEITNCSQLEVLNLSHNGLTGHLTVYLGKLRRMIKLNLSWNNLLGPLPPELSAWKKAEFIMLSNNVFSGTVPRDLSLLENLKVLDLSGNYLSGAVPKGGRHSLSPLVMLGRNCFFPWQLTGQRPRSICSSNPYNLSTVSVFSLPSKQRRGIAELLVSSPATPTSSSSHNHLAAILAGAFGCLALIIFVAIVVFYILRYEQKAEARRKENQTAVQTSIKNKPLGVRALNMPSGRTKNVTLVGEAFPYAQLQAATNQFDLSSMIMAGHTGDLYKGVLNANTHVVVKRIDVGRFKKDLYVLELEFLGRVSHTRLIPFLGHCLDREDEKLLVYKYMPNGDLAYALHRKESPSQPEDVLQSLDWITRLKIAIGAAEGLVYLHHDCSPSLVHRDIKASSILLDDKFEVRLGSLTDGCVQQGEHQSTIIGRLLRLSKSSDQLDSGLPLASCAYDVYCFGKVLLELVSGKLGISGSIDPDADAWLEWALPLIDVHDREPLTKLIDPSLIVDEDLMEEVWATAIIAKSCLNPKASRRPSMKHILRALENPQKVVRDDNSGPIKSRNSLYGTWNLTLFGAWRHFSSESVFGSLREDHSFELNGRGAPSIPGEDPRHNRRPGSSEIFPVPLLPTGAKHEPYDSEQ